MAKSNFLLFLSLLVLFNGSLARHQRQQFSECQLNRLAALKPDHRVESEGGVTESWDPSHEQFRCAGVAVVRRTIQPSGLLLPSYSNAPQVFYIVRGRGMTGTLVSGCPETYQQSQESRGEGSQRFQDQHQKIQHFRQGDVIALPAGVAHWCYNNGDEPVVALTLLDLSNSENQLDFSPRNFYLAGNSEEEFEEREGRREGSESPRQSKAGQQRSNNVFYGIDSRILADAFDINEDAARKLQGRDDRRGNIVKVKGGRLQVVQPPSLREEEREQAGRESGPYNGFEETICTVRIKENIDDPSRADVFSPQAGRISFLNSLTLPILRELQISAERGVLYRDAMMVPHWTLNAHSIIYATRGQARIQVVDHSGQAVFDGEMREGQLLTVPQNFAIVKRAEKERFEWVAFKTNDNAKISTLAGRTSAIRAIPAEVLANAYRISVEEARRIKFSKEDTMVTSPRSQSSDRPHDAQYMSYVMLNTFFI